jgi:MFS family permease
MTFIRFFIENARYLAVGVLLTFLSSFGQTFFISIFAGEIKETFGLSDGQWGGYYTLGTSASAVLMVWAGALTDRFRTRVLGAIILVMLAAACLFMAWNTAAWLLPLVIFALRFTGQGMASHIAVVSMSRWFVRARGKALSVARLGFSLGEALLPIGFVALLIVVDWRHLWVAAAVVTLAFIPVVILLLRQERTPQSFSASDESTGMMGRHWSRAEVIRHWLFWVMVPSIVGLSAFGTAFFFHQVHYAEVKGFTHLGLVALFPVYTGLAVASMVGFGLALDRFGTARLIPWSLLPLVLGFALFAVAQSLFVVAIGMVFFALGGGAFSVLPNAFWAEFYGTKSIGAIKAVAAAAMVFGSAIGPGLTGVLLDLGVSISAQYLGIAIYFGASTALLVIGVGRARQYL